MSVLRQITNQIRNMMVRGTVSGSSEKKMRMLQIRLLSGEVVDDIEHFEPYGFTSGVYDDAEGVAGFLDGDRSHGIVIVVADRRYRLAVEKGEVAIFDDQKQKVHLTRDGIVIDGAGKPLMVKNVPKARFETDLLECTGEIRDKCDLPEGRTMSSMRDWSGSHTHIENGTGSDTDPPTQPI